MSNSGRRAADRVVLALVRELVGARDDEPAQRRQAWLAHSAAVRAWNGVVLSTYERCDLSRSFCALIISRARFQSSSVQLRRS